jgi:chemotaxis protein histidine kinase CheA
MDEKYTALFVDEARELTAKMTEALGHLRSEGFDESAVEDFFRNVHTLKGMASAMGFDEMASLTHRLEDLFQKAKEERQPPSETMLSAAYEAVDFIANSLDEVSQTGQPQTGAAALPSWIRLKWRLPARRPPFRNPKRRPGRTCRTRNRFPPLRRIPLRTKAPRNRPPPKARATALRLK